MKEMVKLGVRLMLFALIASLLLALTYAITKEPIQEQKLRAAMQTRVAVLPGDENFTQVYEGTGEIESIFQSSQGYVFSVRTQGYGSGGVLVTVGLANAGEITGVRVDASGETPGLGAKAGTEAFYGQFSGKTVDNALDVDAISGATITTNAVKKAVELAVDYAKENFGL